MSPSAWHVRQLLDGYVPAVVVGFLLTAVPNWSGRMPIVGAPLMGLFSLWVAGRIAVATSLLLTPVFAAVVDLTLLAILAAVITREFVAGQNCAI